MRQAVWALLHSVALFKATAANNERAIIHTITIQTQQAFGYRQGQATPFARTKKSFLRSVKATYSLQIV